MGNRLRATKDRLERKSTLNEVKNKREQREKPNETCETKGIVKPDDVGRTGNGHRGGRPGKS